MAVVLACLAGPRAAEGCGPFLTSMLFTTYHGALPGEFESGHVPVLRPHFYRRDLLLAYRTLSGVRMSRGESPQAPPETTTPPPPPADHWLKARKEIATVPAPAGVHTDKKAPGSDYQFFENCLDDAFVSATATLRKRTAQWGAASPNLAEWIRGQDQVFQNCDAGPAIPQVLTSGDPVLAADRRYQIAAAQFYAGRFDAAEAGFDKIASDAASPWHEMAPYLAARACIRGATIGGNQAKWGQAADRLAAILKDPARKPWHARAQGLLDFVRSHTEPRQRLEELGKQLMQPDLGPQLERVLTDYTLIWDQMEEKGPMPPAEESDVANWIQKFQAREPAVAEWRAKSTTPWLVAALVTLDANDPAAPEVIAAARALPPSSPAYASATYWGIRYRMVKGDLDAARQWADAALATRPSDAAANLLRAERLKLARDWTEFLRFAPRKPEATGDESYDNAMTDEDLKKKPVAFDLDAAQALNLRVPLNLWIDAAGSDLVPRNLQADIALAGWVRAILLDDAPAARTLAGRVSQLQPALAAEMRGYLAVRDPAAARFSAIFLMLRGPGLEPGVRAGFNRGAPLMERDTFRDNWWDLKNTTAQSGDSSTDHEALYDLYPSGDVGPADFLPNDQRAAGEEQWKRLMERAGNAVNYLGSEAIAWAQAHPQDPRVPQALYQLVEATHYGPADGKKSRDYSRQAFEILHRQYPTSEWTKKTKYWY
jgi:hypothetical protein